MINLFSVLEIYSSIVSETLEACHGSNFYVNILLDAITKKISVNIPPLHQSNTILTCSFSSGKEPLCINVQTVQYKFNQTSKILMFYMKYHHREHAEKALFVNSTRHNGTTSSRKIILLPCRKYAFTCHLCTKKNNSNVTYCNLT